MCIAPFMPTKGITAGSVFATYEIKLIMAGVVDRATRICPRVVPTLCIYDLSAEAMGEEAEVKRGGGAIRVGSPERA